MRCWRVAPWALVAGESAHQTAICACPERAQIAELCADPTRAHRRRGRLSGQDHLRHDGVMPRSAAQDSFRAATH
jgi:hypothetical protein